MWNIETDGIIPEPPFLISSRLELDIVFNGYINLLPDERLDCYSQIIRMVLEPYTEIAYAKGTGFQCFSRSSLSL
jgi:hypothetical protein